MTVSTIELAVTERDRRIALAAAAAIALSFVESALPSPIPGIKPGLANIVVLMVLLRHGWGDAAWVSLLRVLVGGLLFGQFLTPGFLLSLAGALTSLAALAATARLPARFFGPVTHSVCAAFAHIGGQLLLARWLLIGHDGIAYLVPPFLVAALLFGTANGLACAWLLRQPDPDAALRRLLRRKSAAPMTTP